MRPEHGLGRRHAPDPRDTSFPMRPLLAAPITEAPPTRYWNANGWWGDQRSTPQCVAYAWTHWLEDGPVMQPGKGPIVPPATLYAEAQKVDEWPGEDYEGTSVRAGAKALQDRGLVESYHWAWDAETVLQAVLTTGPVVMGTNWYDSMFDTDAQGMVRISGAIAGGHAWLIDGASRYRGVVRAKNSWGRDWGRRGFFWLSMETLERLIHEDGEAALAIEVRAP